MADGRAGVWRSISGALHPPQVVQAALGWRGDGPKRTSRDRYEIPDTSVIVLASIMSHRDAVLHGTTVSSNQTG
jgi:hypothetical protein